MDKQRLHGSPVVIIVEPSVQLRNKLSRLNKKSFHNRVSLYLKRVC